MFFGISGAVILSLLLFMLFTQNASRPVTVPVENQSTESDTGSGLIKLLAWLPVKNISQNPELPTGCEITALTIVLNYWGYSVDKMYMAQNYLAMGEVGKVSFYEAFAGEPWSENGWGCYAPVIFDSASRYLEDQNSNLKVYNLTNQDFEVLLREVELGYPVMVWTCINMEEEPKIKEIVLEDGRVEHWITPEHCVVLTGYDMVKNTVTICDPMDNYETLDMSLFKQRYEDHRKQALVIK